LKTQFQKQNPTLNGEIYLNGSKSISNRLLMLDKICNLNLNFENLSKANDSVVLQRALQGEQSIIDIENCGTAMRFLTAYFAFSNQTVLLTGDTRMQQRPIKPLVDALLSMGANIQYQDKIGFPPLKIMGAKCTNTNIQINASISSQYITALMLIAPMLPNVLVIELIGKIVSTPYIKMSLNLLNQFGVAAKFDDNRILVQNAKCKVQNSTFVVEGDWSSVSYWYSAVALSVNSSITINGLTKNSLQGDSILPSLFSFFGVNTEFIENGIILSKLDFQTEFFVFDFCDNPDLAQTVAVTCAGLKIPCILNGLDNLNLKESNRIEALSNELALCGIKCIATNNSLQLFDFDFDELEKQIDTYKDHRMAMAFLPLCFIMPIEINDSDVVKKSYPNFFEDAKTIGFSFEENLN